MNTPTLTPEQRATIAPYERHLHSAVYADYVVALSTTAATALFNVHNAVFTSNEVNKHCAQCVLRVCQRLGKLYYAEQPTQEATETAKPATKEQPTTTPKKRAPRGSKKASK